MEIITQMVLLSMIVVVVHSQCTTEYCNQQEVDPTIILESNLGYLRDEVTSLKSQLQSVIRQMETVTSANSIQEEKIMQQEQTMSELRETISEQGQFISEQGQFILEQGQTIAQLENKIDNLQMTQTTANLTISSLQTTVVQQAETIAQMDLQSNRTVRAFTARMTGGIQTPTSTSLPVQFSDILINEGGDYNPDTYTFSCSVSGLYIFSFSIYSSYLRRDTSYYLSAAELTHRTSTGVQTAVARVLSRTDDRSNYMYAQSSTTAIIHCSTGDTVWVRPTSTIGNQMWGSTPSSPRSVFTGILISPL